MDFLDAVLAIDPSSSRLCVVEAPNTPPAACFRIKYLSEGNANVIFAVTGTVHGDKLLRVPKVSCGRWTQPDPECVREFKSEDLLNQETVFVPTSMYELLDVYLNQRQTKRLGRTRLYDGSLPSVAAVPGLFVKDMRASNSSGQAAFHFKPKWLTQSPSAPKSSKRCRTCALQASQGSAKTTSHCPLALCSNQIDSVREQISNILDARFSRHAVHLYKEHLTHFFCKELGYHTLQKLGDLQATNDPHGVLSYEKNQKISLETQQMEYVAMRKLSKAMTFRDCTIYVRISNPDALPLKTIDGQLNWTGLRFKTRIGDLDRKLPVDLIESCVHPNPANVKLNEWLRKERELISGGYYEGTEELKDGEQRHTGCYLWT
jgi:inositol-pentakisphosphate 2-kinase